MAKKLAFDKLLLAAVALLLVLGLVMVYSSSSLIRAQVEHRVLLSSSPFFKQLFAAMVGLAAMLVALQADYRLLKRPAVIYAVVLGVITLLVVVLFAPPLNNSHRWLFVGGVSVQVSELAKVAMVLFLAYQIDRKWTRVSHPALVLPCMLLVGLFSLLIIVEPDFGTGVILIGTAALVLFVAGISWRYIAVALALLVPVAAFFVVTEPYRMRRLLSFLRPEEDALGGGYQTLQSLIAVGSGGLFGVGLGQSVQKLDFLPFANSDFIYAILCEELGLLGGLLVLLLFGIIGWRGYEAGRNAPDVFGRHLAWGLTTLILLQVLVHMSITLQLMPVTGTPLPLISYGGSSLVTNLAACGLLLSVSQHA
ncbi:MAG: putative lipid II flippase FtsW [Acidobacteria bacterium]|nr:MAG: putative lipid II flippase FtsW [Acidobacteriota bacterium]REK00465.1 MAG: putative lipid II flippase FtsW [Acidobacteriota bacterium]